VNNTPVAVLIDIKKYEKMIREGNFLNIWVETQHPARRGFRKQK
jgi:hypothetical protein